MKKYIFLVTFVLMIVFIASNMSYEQQTIVPELQTILKDKPFEEELSKIELTYWDMPISVETRGYYYFIEFLIRKATHFSGFGLIGVIFFLFYRKMKFRFPAYFAIASVFILGSLDEYRQKMQPGRTGLFEDVMIDTAGAIFFVFLAKLFLWLLSNRKRVSKRPV
ncbi:VanZ family protein [Lysinibacillus sp. 54212]|uniref:VanZ family protein n=1 Tax=Lysinibacillus sp. 54212 TaxID=3119829 RepID=UPI002FC64817